VDHNAPIRARKFKRDGAAEAPGAAGRSAADRKEQRRAAAEARAAVQHLRQAIREAERRLEKLQAEKARIEAKLADPAVYNGPTRKLMELQLQFGEVKKKIAAAEDAWLEAQAAIEQPADAGA